MKSTALKIVLGAIGGVFIAAVGFALGAHPSDTALALPSSGQLAQAPTANVVSGGVTISGDGEAHAQPDIAVFTVGATQVSSTASAALSDVNQKVTAIISGLKGLGVEDKDIQTTGLSLQPIQRPRQPNDQSPPLIDSYRATNNVIVTIRDLSRAGTALDSAATAGANVIGGIRFTLADSSAIRAQALANATRNATAAAQQVASAAGVQLDNLIAITDESSVSQPIPRSLAASAVSADSSTPIEAGELSLQARVRVTYAIRQ